MREPATWLLLLVPLAVRAAFVPLFAAFCRPASDRGCDHEALSATIGRMHYLTGDRSFRVYRVDPE